MTNSTLIKLIVCTTTVAGGVASIIYFKKKKNAQKETIENDSEVIDSNDNIDTAFFDIEVTKDDQEISTRNKAEIDAYRAYLMKNDKSANVSLICETLSLIEETYRYTEYPKIREQLLDILNNEFDMEKCMEFDNSNFKFMYGSIDPCQFFIQNGFKILALGSDYQEIMMDFAEALAELQEIDRFEYATVMNHIYHILAEHDVEDITPDLYNEFKVYIDRYLTIDSNNEEE